MSLARALLTVIDEVLWSSLPLSSRVTYRLLELEEARRCR